MKKYFVFGDVHGEYDVMVKGLDDSGFEKDNPNHIVISLGDLFDRGLQNIQVLEFVYDLWKKDRLINIRGNHDEFLLDYLSDGDMHLAFINIVHNGMNTTIYEFAEFDDPKKAMSHYEIAAEIINSKYPKLKEFLRYGIDSYDLGKYNFTHAGYSWSNKYEFEEEPLWEVNNWSKTPDFIKFFPESNLYDPKKIYVFGHYHAFRLRKAFQDYHSNKPDPEKFVYKNFIGLDSCVNATFKMEVLVIEENQI